MSESNDRDSDRTNIGVCDVNGVKILLYNVYGLPPLIRSFCKQSYTRQRLEDIFFNQSADPGFLADYDVACFCEVFTDYTKIHVRIIEHMRRLGFGYFARGPKRDIIGGKFVGGGLLLCSKLPIKRTASMTFTVKGSHLHSVDSLAAKGVIYAAIELDECYRLHLALTHAQSSYFSKSKIHDKYISIRRNQFQSLANFLSDQLKISNYTPLDPIVVLGDFNVPAFNLDPDSTISNQEYFTLLETLSLNHKYEVADLIYNASGNRHPITWVSSLKMTSKKRSSGEGCTPGGDSQIGQRLDYIFQLIPASRGIHSENSLTSYSFSSGSDYQWDFVPSSSGVKEFYANKNLRRKYDTLSDHYALTALLCTRKISLNGIF